MMYKIKPCANINVSQGIGGIKYLLWGLGTIIKGVFGILANTFPDTVNPLLSPPSLISPPLFRGGKLISPPFPSPILILHKKIND